MKIAIVGSRFRTCRDEVFKAVAELEDGDVVVSGGAKGVDSWAAEAAMDRGLTVVIFTVKDVKEQMNYVAKLMARNTLIAKECDRVIAFPQHQVDPGHGGTWDTVRKAKKMGKPVDIR